MTGVRLVYRLPTMTDAGFPAETLAPAGHECERCALPLYAAGRAFTPNDLLLCLACAEACPVLQRKRAGRALHGTGLGGGAGHHTPPAGIGPDCARPALGPSLARRRTLPQLYLRSASKVSVPAIVTRWE